MSQGGALMHGVPQKAPSHLPPPEDTASARTFTLDFSGSGTERDKCLLLKPDLLWDFLLQKPQSDEDSTCVCTQVSNAGYNLKS